MCYFKLLLPTILLVVSVSVLQANTIHVPADSVTIQAGINGAVDGDTVLVADGIYTGTGNHDITFVGKAIVVMSENGPENCVIDCQGTYNYPHRGFYFHSGEDSTSVLQGFTITNGFVEGDPGGGGIYCDHSSPTIVENFIVANEVEGWYYAIDNISAIGNFALTTNSNSITGNLAHTYGGGGIRCYYASPTIIRNTIKENYVIHYGNLGTEWVSGGGIQCYSSSPIIKDNVIANNDVSGDGGGIYCGWGSSPTITGNTIVGNVARYAGNGAGISCNYSDPTITGNTITGNTASYNGGGIHCTNASSLIIEQNIIKWNTAENRSGGGIKISGASSANIMGNTIQGNKVDVGGGGISCSYSSATITGNTIMGNTANGSRHEKREGGGIYCYSNASLTITNNIITGNTADGSWHEKREGGGIYCYSNASLTITNNIITGNTAEFNGGGISCSNSSATISGNTITGNWANGNWDEEMGEGGGIYCYSNDSLTITNNTINGNFASLNGGGIYFDNCFPILTGNTITGNAAVSHGGGIYCYGTSNPTIMNSILWRNWPNEIYYQNGYPTVTYSDIQGGWLGVGNIDEDPMFRDPVADDFHLMAIACGDSTDSPCIDAGDPAIVDSLLDCSWGLGIELSDMGAYGGRGGPPVSIKEPKNPKVIPLPKTFSLSQNYPNPFNPTTTITFDVPGTQAEAQHVQLTIYNIRGKQVIRLIDSDYEPGSHRVVWNGRSDDGEQVSSGIYLYTLRSGNSTYTKKMVLVK